MVSCCDSSSSPMAKPNSLKTRASAWVSDGFLFLGGALFAVLLVWSIWSIAAPRSPTASPSFGRSEVRPEPRPETEPKPPREHESPEERRNFAGDSPERNFYDSPETGYSIGSPVRGWDEKRRDWLRKNPSLAGKERVLMITGSQPSACKNPIGDHLLLRFFKNKVDYCRIHGYDVFYNNALLHPKMGSYWAKLPVVRAAMVAHPEAEWIWWVDSDALFTDMEFKLPLDRYKDHDLVVHGWAHLIHEKRSWTGLNAGVFLIRNSQWAMDFLEVWARMGPQTPDYETWGQTLRSTFPDKAFPESDDQTGLAYLIYQRDPKWTDRIYLEGKYYFEGYWEEIVGTFGNTTERYLDIERADQRLRRRHAERASEQYGAFREEHLGAAGYGKGSWRRPFITHFTGCQPCSGDHNQMYSGQSCWDGMRRALNFADNQVLRNFGFLHPHPLDPSVEALPFGYPAS